MSYQVLARKWRPRSFREMVGQAHVLKALINALDHQRLHHAYLFTGTRGVGKTTIARIMAKCLNCEQGISSTPCGVCSVCTEIDEGRFVDLIEVDAASKTKVEDTREMLDNVQYMPTRGRYKVYLIDEVHMLSTSSFNALLKTLEEPPPYVKFILATTDPQKLPATVLSRCLQFSLKNIAPEPIVGHLKNVLNSENIPFEDGALWLLGRAADGSMRDAMSLTDQAVSFGDGSVMVEDVRAMLGTLDQGQIYGVLKALLAGDARAALAATAHLAEHGPDWAGVLAEILNALHRIAIAQLMPDAIDNGQGDREQVLELAAQVPPEDIQFYYQLGLIGRRDLPLAPDPRDGFEMILLRMLAFRPADLPGAPPSTTLIQEQLAEKNTTVVPTPVPSAISKPAAEQEVAAVTQTGHVGEGSAVVVQPEVGAKSVSALKSIEEIHAPWEDVPPSIEGTGARSAELSASRSDLQPSAAESDFSRIPVVSDDVFQTDEVPYSDADYAQAFSADLDDDAHLDAAQFENYAELPRFSDDEVELLQGANGTVDLKQHIPPASGLAAEWQNVFLQLNLAGMAQNIAANTVLVEKKSDSWLLHLDPNHSALFNKTQQKRINDAINTVLGVEIELHIELQEPEQETPALALIRQQAKRQHEAEAAIHADPVVLQLMDTFGATISANSIEPLD
ncbi:DNA polymerase III subunit gamma/tau [Denitrificimonas sp. JX-1]|uniref:DNA polymerase III subunit gamma/tau n=1 Tax=Denitrificimonas halotolerans TaxID=3098930 RepID=A0ABU5GTY5_9GAMM|nr:DNA polymerase III subunit gamma/tau [Denitrificimonas sp. JX-1]MDY7220448.1 DNA polymerase III subunit gamma/tau [Denitrificimonas sp. JX-1]